MQENYYIDKQSDFLGLKLFIYLLISFHYNSCIYFSKIGLLYVYNNPILPLMLVLILDTNSSFFIFYTQHTE